MIQLQMVEVVCKPHDAKDFTGRFGRPDNLTKLLSISVRLFCKKKITRPRLYTDGILRKLRR